jgi:type III restriction enzyme
VDVQKSDDVVDLHKANGSEKCFEALSAMPSYIVPRKRKTSQVRRLKKFARLLTNDEIDDDALSKADDILLDVLNTEYNQVKRSKRFKEIVEERSKIEIEAVNWDVGAEAVREGQTVKVDIASENVEDLFEATGRKLTEGLHKAWWRSRVKNDPAYREKAKLELFALCLDPDLTRKIEKVAQETVQQWLRTHAAAIAGLEEGSRAGYDEIRNLAANPELTPLVYPATIQGKQADRTWDKHIYVTNDGSFPASFNNAETEILERELASEDVVGWLRNIDRKPWALCIPYEVDGEDRPMYPDFLIVRKEDRRLVVDLIDPHSIGLADAPAKAAGLARFAAQHADKFGSIELIMADGKTSKRFDLTDERVRNKIRGIKVIDQMRKLFDEA